MVERGSRREADAANGRDALRAAILNGQYLPGERLFEAQLCEDLGISRFNVRAALQDLSRDPKINLEARIPHGEGQTYLREILLVADHTAYHIGELVVVRRLLGAWPPGRSAKA